MPQPDDERGEDYGRDRQRRIPDANHHKLSRPREDQRAHQSSFHGTQARLPGQRTEHEPDSEAADTNGDSFPGSGQSTREGERHAAG